MTIGEMNSLLLEAESREMSKEEVREQEIGFAYGNANIENKAVTREVVKLAAAKFDQLGESFAAQGLQDVPAARVDWRRIV